MGSRLFWFRSGLKCRGVDFPSQRGVPKRYYAKERKERHTFEGAFESKGPDDRSARVKGKAGNNVNGGGHRVDLSSAFGLWNDKLKPPELSKKSPLERLEEYRDHVEVQRKKVMDDGESELSETSNRIRGHRTGKYSPKMRPLKENDSGMDRFVKRERVGKEKNLKGMEDLDLQNLDQNQRPLSYIGGVMPSVPLDDDTFAFMSGQRDGRFKRAPKDHTMYKNNRRGAPRVIEAKYDGIYDEEGDDFVINMGDLDQSFPLSLTALTRIDDEMDDDILGLNKLEMIGVDGEILEDGVELDEHNIPTKKSVFDRTDPHSIDSKHVMDEFLMDDLVVKRSIGGMDDNRHGSGDFCVDGIYEGEGGGVSSSANGYIEKENEELEIPEDDEARECVLAEFELMSANERRAEELILDTPPDQLSSASSYGSTGVPVDLQLSSELGLFQGVIDIYDRILNAKQMKMLVEARKRQRWEIWKAKTWEIRQERQRQRRERIEQRKKAVKDNTHPSSYYYPDLDCWVSKRELTNPIFRNAISAIINNPSWSLKDKREFIHCIGKDLTDIENGPDPEVREMIQETIDIIEPKPIVDDTREIEHLLALPYNDWRQLINEAEDAMEPHERASKYDIPSFETN